MTETGVIDMNSYASISIMALVCYLYLFLVLAASEKTRLIRSFMLLLAAMILWTGGSFAMRMQFGPSVRFWYDVSLLGLMFLPYVFYNFTAIFSGRTRDGFCYVWLAFSVVMSIINTRTHFFLAAPQPVNLHGTTVFLYDFTWRTYVMAALFAICFLQIVVMVLRCVRDSELLRHQFLPILAGFGILLMGNSLIMLDVFKGFPLDILSGVINAFLLFYVLYKRRLFKLTLLVSRGNCYAISAGITVLLFSNLLLPMRSFIDQNFKPFAAYSLLLVFLLFTLATAFIYSLLKRFIDTVFIREEKQQADSLKIFSQNVRKTLSVSEIAEDICKVITDTIDVSRVYVCMKDSEGSGYHILYGNAPLERQNYAIDGGNPILSVLKQQADCLLYRDFKRTAGYRSMWEQEKELFDSLHIECVVPLMEQELIGMMLLSRKVKKASFSYDELNFLSSVASISTIALKNSQLYEMAYHEAISDELTGLLNRKYFYKNFYEIYNARKKDSTLTLILVSLDDVRLYNQLYGTREGDKAIAQAAEIMRRVLGSNAVAARISGKEFAILLEECSLQDAKKLAEMIRQQIMNMNKAEEGYALKVVTGSFGIASIPLLASNPKQLEEYANQALYQAKRKGKNRVVIYNEEEGESVSASRQEQDKESIYSEYASTIYALTAAIDTKDHYTFTHSKNVAYYATELAYAIGLKEDVVEIIREAALLHDIGKIGIREDILNKHGRLTKEEYEIMKGHVENSIGIIRYLPSLDYVIPAVISHHERWDGHGYPRRIAKEDIPLGGRILCIADSFDAMTSTRSYKDACNLSYAIHELTEQAGRQFDPYLAEVFVKLLKEHTITIQEEQISV